ncbi:MAG: glycosyl hydrolase 108 family protein [Candidatus Nitrosotenuis sp.]
MPSELVFPPAFIKAFNFTMRYEVGPKFNPDDPDVIEGLCRTKEQQRKTGYVNDSADKGGETKFGVAKNSHPSVNIKRMTLKDAMSIYEKGYWEAGHADELSDKLGVLHFDSCVNHGISRGIKMLQEALGTRADGVFGKNTLSAIQTIDEDKAIENYLNIRTRYFNNLALRDPSQNRFLNGWLARVESIRTLLS